MHQTLNLNTKAVINNKTYRAGTVKSRQKGLAMKEHWQLECEWEDRFRQGNYARNIWKYIPQRKREGVTDAFIDSDGYWIWLEPGWTAYDGAEDCSQIHEYTIEMLKDAIKTIRRK